MKKSGYDFYLKRCLLPVPPDKLEIKINNANDTLTLIDEGEINILKQAELTDIEFECRIPQTKYPFAAYKSGFKKASYFLNYFEKLKTKKKPFQFIVSRAAPNGKLFFSTNMKVSLEDYKITEQAKNGFDLIVKIKLKQYRAYGTKTVSIKSTSSSSKPKATVKTKRAESTVQGSEPIEIGSDVIVNGQFFASSYGDSPGISKTDYRGKVNFINKSGTHPYHITTPDGGWLGWVEEKSVKGV